MEVDMAAPSRRRRSAIAVLAALLLTGGVAACGDDEDSGGEAASGASTTTQAAEPAAGDTTAGSGVTDYVEYTGGKEGAADAGAEPVRIGWTTQQGGPADPSAFATDGAKFAVKYINEQLGGIGGRPVELVTCFTSTTEEQGQSCGQKLANDDDVHVVAVGGQTIGAQSLMGAIDGAKPMVYSVAAGPSDATNPNGYILFGDLIRVMPPLATFTKEVLKAKSSAVIFPEAPGVSQAATALDDGPGEGRRRAQEGGLPAERDGSHGSAHRGRRPDRGRRQPHRAAAPVRERRQGAGAGRREGATSSRTRCA